MPGEKRTREGGPDDIQIWPVKDFIEALFSGKVS